MSFKTYTVGRSKKADFIIDDASVSRIHLEITVTHLGRIYCIDCRSTQGTFINKNGQWQPLRQGYVSPEAQLVVGDKTICPATLLGSKIQTATLAQSAVIEFEPISVKPRRNVSTGEVEREHRRWLQKE